MLSSSLTTYQDLNLTHSCSAGSGRKNSFHLELEMQFVQFVRFVQFVQFIRATVLTFKQEELEKWDPLLNIKGLSWNISLKWRWPNPPYIPTKAMKSCTTIITLVLSFTETNFPRSHLPQTSCPINSLGKRFSMKELKRLGKRILITSSYCPNMSQATDSIKSWDTTSVE